jgi:hypothetical protein
MGAITKKGHKIWEWHYDDTMELLYHTREGETYIYKQETERLRHTRRSNKWRQHRRGTSRDRVIGRICMVKKGNRGKVTIIAHLAVSPKCQHPGTFKKYS